MKVFLAWSSTLASFVILASGDNMGLWVPNCGDTVGRLPGGMEKSFGANNPGVNINSIYAGSTYNVSRATPSPSASWSWEPTQGREFLKSPYIPRGACAEEKTTSSSQPSATTILGPLIADARTTQGEQTMGSSPHTTKTKTTKAALTTYGASTTATPPASTLTNIPGAQLDRCAESLTFRTNEDFFWRAMWTFCQGFKLKSGKAVRLAWNGVAVESYQDPDDSKLTYWLKIVNVDNNKEPAAPVQVDTTAISACHDKLWYVWSICKIQGHRYGSLNATGFSWRAWAYREVETDT